LSAHVRWYEKQKYTPRTEYNAGTIACLNYISAKAEWTNSSRYPASFKDMTSRKI